MKKRVSRILLLILLLADAVGVVCLFFARKDDVFSLFGLSGEKKLPISGPLWALVAMLLLFVILLILLLCTKKTAERTPLAGELPSGLTGKKLLRQTYESTDILPHRTVALAYIGFDSKKLNGVFSTKLCGDAQAGAERVLLAFCGPHDYACRLDEGSFAVSFCCKDAVDADDRMTELAHKLNNSQFGVLMENAAPFHIGIFLPDAGGSAFEKALDNARLGYRYACEGETFTLICTRDLIILDETKRRLHEELSRAIDAKEFDIYLQFVYNVKKDRFAGAEVLSRWNNPREGLLMPAYYINDMRNTGVIEKFDMYMLERTCDLLQKWSGTEFGDLILSCNITRITVSSENFIKNLNKILKKYTFDHRLLILEITEDALIDNQALAFRNIVECKTEGLRIAIDDFGAGNSSFTDISDYPVDQIKIDRQLSIKTTTPRGATLLQGLVELAHRMNAEVVCEGIETQMQKEAVEQNGCDYIQGYYYSYVLSVEEGKSHYLDSLKA